MENKMKKIFFGILIITALGFISLTLIKMPAPTKETTKEVNV